MHTVARENEEPSGRNSHLSRKLVEPELASLRNEQAGRGFQSGEVMRDLGDGPGLSWKREGNGVFDKRRAGIGGGGGERGGRGGVVVLLLLLLLAVVEDLVVRGSGNGLRESTEVGTGEEEDVERVSGSLRAN